MAKARRLASEFAKAKDLNEQVIQYAGQYGETALQVAQQGVSVAMLRDTMAFRNRLLAGAKDQELANADLFKRFQEANRDALSAKLKSQGLDRAMERRKREAERAKAASPPQEQARPDVVLTEDQRAERAAVLADVVANMRAKAFGSE
jgi:hypothetical protein